MINYFDSESAAARYVKGRPYVHPKVIARLKDHLVLNDELLERVLDVACGTGLSTHALKAVARQIVGTDISQAMIGLAPCDEAISYVRASAESLPFADNTFNLLTVSSAFHWLNPAKFLSEAYRVLQPNGYVAIYNYDGRGYMLEKAGLIHQYPHSIQKWPDLQDADVEPYGFEFVINDQGQYPEHQTLETVVNQLLSQSNVIAVVDRGDKTLEEVRDEFTQGLRPFFKADLTIELTYHMQLWILRRQS